MMFQVGRAADDTNVPITSGYGVIIPAPEDPSVCGQSVPPHLSSSSSGAIPGFDDVPIEYICTIGRK